MKVLVTGGAGFIGSHVVDELIAAGCDVTIVDILHGWAHTSDPSYIPGSATFERVDLRDEKALRAVVTDADAVSHQASVVGLESSFADAREYVDHNALGTASLLSALHHTDFTGPLVLGSSMVVYGEGAYECREHGRVRPGPRSRRALDRGEFEPVCGSCGESLRPTATTETDRLEPRNVYAATKLHQEHLAAIFGREHGVAVCALRYHNVYGPRMPANTPYAGVASIFRNAIAAGRPLEVFEDGRQMRDFIHVRDVARANVRALSSAISGTFNIATGEPHSIGEVATALVEASPAGTHPPVVSGRHRLGDVRHVFASPDRARRALGFTAEISFAEGMREFAHEPLRAA
jgi:dTDP-L-rhamnose 4-epimerase